VRDDVVDLFRFVGVVEDEQPVAVRITAAHRVGGVLDAAGGRGRQAQPGARTGERRPDQQWLVGRDPPDGVIFRPVTVGLLDRYLDLADAAEPVQSVRHDAVTCPAMPLWSLVSSSRPVKFLFRGGILPQTS
jgi:hypothetical protein